jgi:hypothetical protein
MKIAATDLALQASRTQLVRQESQETLRSWRGERPDFEGAAAGKSTAGLMSANSLLARPTPTGLQSSLTDISAMARRLFAASSLVPAVGPMVTPTFSAAPNFAVPSLVPAVGPMVAPTFSAASTDAAAAVAGDGTDGDPFLLLVKQMVEMITGQEVRVFNMADFSASLSRVEARSSEATAAIANSSAGRAGYGVEYDYHAVREEFEQTSFSATGVVRTTDGQELSFTLDLEMTRYYREESSVSLRAGDAVRKDPLVVNFGGTAAQLSAAAGQRFRFDIDGDGQLDSLPLFTSGSGYLALDRNGDGRIDNATELFGPASDNGFAELALLDDDGNNWIDEGDAAFDKLLVWTPAAEGAGDLRKLANLGIGALGLQHIASPFALRGSANQDLGQVRASGVYLGEDGRTGSLQEIDLTV